MHNELELIITKKELEAYYWKLQDILYRWEQIGKGNGQEKGQKDEGERVVCSASGENAEALGERV